MAADSVSKHVDCGWTTEKKTIHSKPNGQLNLWFTLKMTLFTVGTFPCLLYTMKKKSLIKPLLIILLSKELLSEL